MEIISHAPRERVSWNSIAHLLNRLQNGHAPRERVSWNINVAIWLMIICVTLHVSVWVEINGIYGKGTEKASRSTWACELKYAVCEQEIKGYFVTLHVSVWVEIFELYVCRNGIGSRSTWACELKLKNGRVQTAFLWSRSTWACELKLVWFYHCKILTQSRSTWACELKCKFLQFNRGKCVSRSTWACELKCEAKWLFWGSILVTLHVSVWVEIW